MQKCIKSNIHNRSAADIEKAYHDWKEAPAHYIQVDFSSLLKEPEPDSHCENVSNDSEIIDDVADNTNSSTQDQLGEVSISFQIFVFFVSPEQASLFMNFCVFVILGHF